MLPSRVAAVLLVGVVASGCGARADGTSPRPSDRPAPPLPATGSAEPSATPAPSIAPSTAPSATGSMGTDEPPPLALAEVAAGLADPIGITGAPDGSLLVNEQVGRVIRVDPSSGGTSVVVDLTDRIGSGGERGLLGLALHPGWPDVPLAVIHYTDLDGNTVISTFRRVDGAEALELDPASEQVLLREVQPYPNHNGGQLSFGPDGMLYIGLGDGGSGGDPLGNGQNPNARLGKILRIDVDADGGAYAVPGDNPFADGADGAAEVFLLGLRNPWRFSFDRETGLLWIADVGQNAYEEINRVDPASDVGANLGWNVMEASHCFATADCARDGLVVPLVEYGHDLGCSVTGGAVYRGEALDGLRGWYVFSDFCSGLLFGVRADAEQPADGALAPTVLLETGRNVAAFGEGADGELYIADVGSGSIYRIVADGD